MRGPSPVEPEGYKSEIRLEAAKRAGRGAERSGPHRPMVVRALETLSWQRDVAAPLSRRGARTGRLDPLRAMLVAETLPSLRRLRAMDG